MAERYLFSLNIGIYELLSVPLMQKHYGSLLEGHTCKQLIGRYNKFTLLHETTAALMLPTLLCFIT